MRRLILEEWIDGYHFQLWPTVVGGGRPLFPALSSYANLHRVDVRMYDKGVVFLNYEPKR